MKLLLSVGFCLGLAAVVTSLTCNVCKFRFSSFCITTSTVETCTGNCSTIKGYVGTLHLFSKLSCDAACEAKNRTTDSVFSYEYSNDCCSTDRCNSGSSAKLSLSLGVGMLLMWLLKAL